MDVPLEDQRAPGFPGLHAAAVRGPEEDLQDRRRPGVPLPRLRHRRLGGGDHQHAVARRQGAVLARSASSRICGPTSASGTASTVEALDVEWGEGVPVERMRAHPQGRQGHAIKAVLVCHNETATGVTTRCRRRAQARSTPPGIRRCCSSMRRQLARLHRFPHGRMGRRCSRSPARRRASCCRPASPSWRSARRRWRRARRRKLPRCFFDFADMIRTNKDGFFPYTPATTLLRGLRASVDLLLGGGPGRTSSPGTTGWPKACARRWRPGACSCARRSRNGTPTR